MVLAETMQMLYYTFLQLFRPEMIGDHCRKINKPDKK